MMPPAASHKKLSAEQKKLLTDWVAAGAEYQPHWSFIAPVRPPLPDGAGQSVAAQPASTISSWRGSSVGLEAGARGRSPHAGPPALPRHTGLPPEPADVEAFVADTAARCVRDAMSIGCWPRRHWGEHRGRYWLDAARYADTHGIHFDNYREMLGLSRLGHQRLQPQHAVRSVHDRAIGRRPAAQSHARSAGGLGLQSLQHDDQRRGRHSGRIPGPVHPRPDRNRVAGLAGHDGRLRGVPRSQVRPALAARVLRDGGVLQQHHARGDGRQHQGHAAHGGRADSRGSPAWEKLPGELAAAQQQIDGRRAAARGDFDGWLARGRRPTVEASTGRRWLGIPRPAWAKATATCWPCRSAGSRSRDARPASRPGIPA